MRQSYSIIIPVYNRPQEVEELLDGLCNQTYEYPFQVIVVDDGSEEDCKKVVDGYRHLIDIEYYYKENSGPGLTRNFGFEKAKGTYFIVFDSDCVIPQEYLEMVDISLIENYTDIFGGPDAADDDFSTVQKAINFSMTSILTTGGIRGKKNAVGEFQPRSFNLGMSRKAFELTGGFGEMRVGEDIDFSLRAKSLGLKSQLISDAFVYHKRRTNFYEFYLQTFAFGNARPFLNRKFKGTAKITYWFPTLFVLFYSAALVMAFYNIWVPMYAVFVYLGLIFLVSTYENKNLVVGLLSMLSTMIQFFGYGLGFLKGTLKLK